MNPWIIVFFKSFAENWRNLITTIIVSPNIPFSCIRSHLEKQTQKNKCDTEKMIKKYRNRELRVFLPAVWHCVKTPQRLWIWRQLFLFFSCSSLLLTFFRAQFEFGLLQIVALLWGIKRKWANCGHSLRNKQYETRARSAFYFCIKQNNVVILGILNKFL